MSGFNDLVTSLLDLEAMLWRLSPLVSWIIVLSMMSRVDMLQSLHPRSFERRIVTISNFAPIFTDVLSKERPHDF